MMPRHPHGSAQVHGFDRRGFLKGSATAIILAGVSPWLVGTTAGGGSLLTEAVFQGLVGQWFHVASTTSVPVQLVAVVDGPASADSSQFTLFFSAPGASIPEGTFSVTPPTGDVFDLFLQPISNGTAPLTLRASFNLLLPTPTAPACA
jgi:hypothetical protein